MANSQHINMLRESIEGGDNVAELRDFYVRVFSSNSLTVRAMMIMVVDREKQTLPKGGDAKPLA